MCGRMRVVLADAGPQAATSQLRACLTCAEEEVHSLAHALSHFSFQLSGGELVVCDLQGAGHMLTDPQVRPSPATAISALSQLGSHVVHVPDSAHSSKSRFVAAGRCTASCIMHAGQLGGRRVRLVRPGPAGD